MKTTPIYLLLIFIFTGCTISPSPTVDNSSQQKIPEWVSILPKMEGKMYAVGISDNGKLLSLVNALITLSQSIEVTLRTSDIEVSSENGFRFGNVSISSLYKSYESTSSDTIREFSENIVKMVYGKQNSSMLITAFNSETREDDIFENKGYNSITYRNADYSDIAKELESVGVVIKSTFQNNTHYYTLLELTESLYENQMKPKEELTEEEKKSLFEDLDKALKKLK